MESPKKFINKIKNKWNHTEPKPKPNYNDSNYFLFSHSIATDLDLYDKYLRENETTAKLPKIDEDEEEEEEEEEEKKNEKENEKINIVSSNIMEKNENFNNDDNNNNDKKSDNDKLKKTSYLFSVGNGSMPSQDSCEYLYNLYKYDFNKDFLFKNGN